MNQATLTSLPALRWGNAALIALLLGSIGIVGVVVVKAPGLVILLPVVVVAASVASFLFTKPRLNFIVWLGGLALLFSSEPGFQLHEVLYGLYFYSYLAHWYGRRLFLYKSPFIRGSVDLAIAAWLVLGLGLGISLGLLFGADFLRLRGEAIALTMLAIYFPIRDFCERDKHGLVIILAIIAWIGIWITVDNLLTARRTFAAATMLWEIADVRTSGRELLLTFPGIILLSVLPTLKRHSLRILVTCILGILIAGLVLTKSRTFWVEYLVAVAILIAISPGLERRRLMLWCAAGASLLFLFSVLFLSSYFDLLITGISSRFATIGSASTDMSLLNRFVETETVWHHIKSNPILGYGFGKTYTLYDITLMGTQTRSYSHVGLVAVVYKFGLWGALIVGFTWVRSLLVVFQSSRLRSATLLDRAVLRGILACSFSMVIPALTTSVFFEDEKLAAFTIITALGMGLCYRKSNPTSLPRASA